MNFSPPALSLDIPPDPSTPHQNPYTISPAVISVIGAVGSIFLVISYYHVLLKYCAAFERLVHRRERRNQNRTETDETSFEVSSSGLEAALIARIPIRKYNPKDGNMGTECSVCLTEFNDGELVRVLPKCWHAFHISCIGMWFNTHSNCPLCRTDVLLGLFQLSSSVEDDQEACPAQNVTGSVMAESGDSQAGFDSLAFHSSPQEANTVQRRPELTDASDLRDGGSSSQWYRRFRWSKRSSSSSREEIYSRLLQASSSVGNDRPRQVAIDLGEPRASHAVENISHGNSKHHESNGDEGESDSSETRRNF